MRAPPSTMSTLHLIKLVTGMHCSKYRSSTSPSGHTRPIRTDRV